MPQEYSQQDEILNHQAQPLLGSPPQTKQVPALLRYMIYAMVLAPLFPLIKKIAGDEGYAPNNSTSVPVCAIPLNMTYGDDPDTIRHPYTSVFMVQDFFMALALTAYPLLRFALNKSADLSSFRGILIETSLLWACYLLETCFKPEIKDHCNIVEVLGKIFAFSVVMLTVYSFRDPIRRTDMTEALELIREFMIDLATIVTGRVRKACSACSACGALSFFTEKHEKLNHAADAAQESQAQPEIIITSTASAT